MNRAAFAGPALTRLIPGRIAPALDQHAVAELKANWERIERGEPLLPVEPLQ